MSTVERVVRLGRTEAKDFVEELVRWQAGYVAQANAKLTTEAEKNELLRMASICQSVQACLEGWADGWQDRIDWGAKPGETVVP